MLMNDLRHNHPGDCRGRSRTISRTSGFAVGLAACLVAFGAVADTAAKADSPPPFRAPRSGSVDVPLMMTDGIAPLPALTMQTKAGRSFVSNHTGTFNGRRMKYRAVIDETSIEDGSGKPLANVFTTSYIAQPQRAERPVLFLFNGGPGSSSIFLHLISLGPKVLLEDSGRFIENEQSPLDALDLVFVDPVETGFGKAEPGAAERFKSVDSDSEAMSAVVRQWLENHGRMSSPKFLLGESYGSLRVIAMARDLARSEDKVVVDGIVLAGFAITFGQNGRVPHPALMATELPMMASVAWHHGKIDNENQTWEQAVDKARRFMVDEYVGALMLGHRIDPERRERIIKQLPGIIGIPESYFRENNTLAVESFNSELLKAEGLQLDRNNGLEARPVAADKSLEAVLKELMERYASYARTMEAYAAKDLKAPGLGEYRFFTDPGKSWNFTTAGAPALDVTLANLMHEHPAMKLLILQGRYDTLTDLGSTEYVMGQTNIPLERYHIAYYDGGHVVAREAEAIDPLRKLAAGEQAN